MFDFLTISERLVISLTILLVYSFLIYPVLLFIFSRLFTKKINISDIKPNVTILISAFNEEELIEDAIASIYHSDYPVKKIRILVGSDGSTDKTFEIVQKLGNQFNNLESFNYERIGKNSVLNFLCSKVKTDLTFFLDADCRLQENTLSNLVSILSDVKIGAVLSSMNQIDVAYNDSTGRYGETMYQVYERYLRIYESNINSTVNGLGAFYGIKMEYYKPLPNNLVCDDLMPLYNVCLAKKRVIFDSQSVVNEVRKKSLTNEFYRRVRVTAGGMSTVFAAKKLLLPTYGWVSFFLYSHKVVRWLSPFFLISLGVLTLIHKHQSMLWDIATITQIVFYCLAIAGWIMEFFHKKLLVLRIVLFFMYMNLGFLLGFFSFVIGKNNAVWDKKN